MSKKYSVAIIDEHPLLAEGVRQVLRSVDNFDIVGSGSSIEDAVSITQEKQPNLLILGVNFPGGGLETARRVRSVSPETMIVFLTSSENDEHVAEALRDGAKGYILKGIEKSEFVKIIGDIAVGRFYVNPALAARMLGRARHPDSGGKMPSGLEDLTQREREIITHVARGMTNKEVAVVLRLGEKTVKHHMTSIMQKLHVRNRLEAVLLLREKLGPAVTVGTPAEAGVARPTAAVGPAVKTPRNPIATLWRAAGGDIGRRRG